MFQKHVSSVLSVFGRMLQMLYLDVSKLDRMLHMGTRVESGRGHERSRAQSGGTGDIRVARETSEATLVETC
jgi:hypothetical protein